MSENTEQMQAFAKVADAIMEPFKKPVSVIYFDAGMLYDFRLGNLILHVTDESQYQYIMSRLDIYENSSSAKVTDSFPDLGITEEQLDAFENDPIMNWQIAVASPQTKLLADLGSFITAVNTLNESKEVKDPLRIIINQRTVKLHRVVQRSLTRFIKHLNKDCIVEFSDYASWDEMPVEVFDAIDVLFVNDIEGFVRHGSVPQKRMAEMHEDCLKKIVVATYRTDKSFDTEEELKDAVTNFTNIMSVMFSGFTFIKRELSR